MPYQLPGILEVICAVPLRPHRRRTGAISGSTGSARRQDQPASLLVVQGQQLNIRPSPSFRCPLCDATRNAKAQQHPQAKISTSETEIKALTDRLEAAERLSEQLVARNRDLEITAHLASQAPNAQLVGNRHKHADIHALSNMDGPFIGDQALHSSPMVATC